MAHTVDSPSGRPADGLELGELNASHKGHDSDNEDGFLLSEHEAKDSISMHQPEPVSANKQAVFWIVVNTVATILIVRRPQPLQ